MSDDYGQEIDWRAVAARQTEYLTERLVSAWGTDITYQLRKVMRRIANGIGTDEQKTLADAITAIRTRPIVVWTLRVDDMVSVHRTEDLAYESLRTDHGDGPKPESQFDLLNHMRAIGFDVSIERHVTN
jgi:hypothetical protein